MLAIVAPIALSIVCYFVYPPALLNYFCWNNKFLFFHCITKAMLTFKWPFLYRLKKEKIPLYELILSDFVCFILFLLFQVSFNIYRIRLLSVWPQAFFFFERNTNKNYFILFFLLAMKSDNLGKLFFPEK